MTTEMRPFFLFSANFSDFALAIVERMARRGPAVRPCGLMTGGGVQLQEMLARHPLTRAARIDDLATLEHAWLACPVDVRTKQLVLEHFSGSDLRRIMIADRQVGSRWVVGGVQRETPLIQLCRDDDAMERYTWHLCEWVIELHRSTGFDRAFCYALAGAPGAAVALYCEHHSVPFRKLTSSRVGNRYVVDSSPVDTLPTIFREGSEMGEESRFFAVRYLREFRKRPHSPSYEARNRDRLEKSTSLGTVARTLVRDMGVLAVGCFRDAPLYLRRPLESSRLSENLTTRLRAWRLAREWPYAKAEDVTGEFVFFPLHVDPEASTMMLAPMFTDQIAVVEALSKVVPPDIRLVVKEHAPMLGRRPAGFYRRLARIPGVMLLSPSVDPFPLLERAHFVATITGTAGWESLLLGGKTLLFGSAPYCNVGSGLIRCTDFEALPQLVTRLREAGPATDEDLLDYISAVHGSSFDHDWWNEPFESLPAERRDELAGFIAERLVELETPSTARVSG